MGTLDLNLTQQDFNYIKSLMRRESGVVLAEDRYNLVYGRLSELVRAHACKNFTEYCQFLRSGSRKHIEEMVNALTTNMTEFFREVHHFHYLNKVILPQLKEHSAQHEVRIWSAACSTGPEPYSIAIEVLNFFQTLFCWDIKIIASDIDSDVLETARRGVYKMDSIKSVMADYIMAERIRPWLLRGSGSNKGFFKVADQLKSLINFQKVNLFDKLPFNELFDVIFCRNVLFYFDRDDQAAIQKKLISQLKDGGYLILGHAEKLYHPEEMTTVEKTIYRKLSPEL